VQMLPGVAQNLPHVFGAHKILRQRKPRADHKRSDQVERGEHQKCKPPMPMSRDDAAEKASEKSADYRSRDVRRHGPSHATSGPFFIHVSEHDGNHAGHEESLRKAPENKRVQTSRSRRQRGGNRQQKQRSTMTFLRPRRSAIMPMMGAVRAVAKIVALTVKLTCNSVA